MIRLRRTDADLAVAEQLQRGLRQPGAPAAVGADQHVVGLEVAVQEADRVRGGEAVDGASLRARWPHAAGFVLDGHAPGQPGGSGQRLDAAAVPADLDRPWLLAGGLDPDNVADAVRAVRPWGVDVAGGIELAPGIKDGARMRRFVEAVREADLEGDSPARIG